MFSSSIFSRLLKLLPEDELTSLTASYGSDRWRKRFKTRDHLLALLAAQLTGAQSLRELETIFNSQTHHHYHLRCGEVRRSTLADANRGRCPEVFRDLALFMMSRLGRGSSDAAKLITILDSSQLQLSSRGHDWAKPLRTRGYNQGLKLHVSYHPDVSLPAYVEVTSSNVNDVTLALDFPLETGTIYVFDKGYCDYNWWKEIADVGADFVTRLKRNARFEVLQERPIEPDQEFILQDRVIALTNRRPRADKINELAGAPLRLIEIRHPGGKKRPFWIVSNLLEASAEEIAGYYKQRWAIELFFKWIKQNLKIKRFLGESRNAILIQIYCALITYLLLHQAHKMGLSPSSLRLKDTLTWLRTNLFDRPDTVRKRRQYYDQKNQHQTELWQTI